MGILTTEAINKQMKNKKLSERLIVTPLLDKKQIGESSIDLRLNCHFLLTKRAKCSQINPRDKELKRQIQTYQEELNVPYGEEIVIHPNQFILGSSLEYIKIPMHLAAYVIGRSSWGRLGLLIATAIFVHPGFSGCLTFELINAGSVPIHIPVGVRIAQLVVHEGKGELSKEESIRYIGQIKPEFSKVYMDEDLEKISKIVKLINARVKD